MAPNPYIMGGMMAAEIGGGMYQASQNRSIANRDRDYHFYMSNSAHTRQTKDLEAAGLNRILGVATQGAPAGGTTSPDAENIMKGTAATALDTMRLKKEIKAVDSQAELNYQTGRTAAAQEAAARANEEKTRNETLALKAQMPAIAAQAKADAREATYQGSDIGFTAKRVNEAAAVIKNVMPGLIINPGGTKARKGPPAIPPGSNSNKLKPLR